MTRLAGTSLVALAISVLLASLSLVAWRQARAIETLEQVDSLRRELTLSEAELADLEQRVTLLESRGWVVPEAGERLEMHVATASEIVYLSREGS